MKARKRNATVLNSGDGTDRNKGPAELISWGQLGTVGDVLNADVHF